MFGRCEAVSLAIGASASLHSTELVLTESISLNYTRHIRWLRCCSLRGLAIEHHLDNPETLLPEAGIRLSSVNLFAGPNGSGKTTMLDAIRSLFEPEMLAKLRRENIPSGIVSGLSVCFDSGTRVAASFHQAGTPQDSLRAVEWNWQLTRLQVLVVDVLENGHYFESLGNLPVIGEVEDKFLRPFQECLSKLGWVGRSWSSDRCSNPSLDDYASILQRFQSWFPHNRDLSVGSGLTTTVRPGDIVVIDGHLHQYHGDDLRQSSRLTLDFLPSGWRQVVELLSWVERCDDHTICVIDEPERHLHPTLQRVLVAELSSLQTRKNLQFVIATHSPTFLNRRAWGRGDVSLFQMSQGRPVAEPALDRILDQLGCVANDICQSNGVIWVEGPSDRIYINAFLRAWQNARRPLRQPFVENVDYSFSFFGGSCLSHFTGTQVSNQRHGADDSVLDLVSLFSLNRNLAICIDRDNDFTVDDFGSQIPVNAHGKTKMRVISQLIEVGQPVIHITNDYTMECYAASVMPEGFLNISTGRVVVVGNKVQHAISFAQMAEEEIYSCIKRDWRLELFLVQLDAAIIRWGMGTQSGEDCD